MTGHDITCHSMTQHNNVTLLNNYSKHKLETLNLKLSAALNLYSTSLKSIKRLLTAQTISSLKSPKKVLERTNISHVAMETRCLYCHGNIASWKRWYRDD